MDHRQLPLSARRSALESCPGARRPPAPDQGPPRRASGTTAPARPRPIAAPRVENRRIGAVQRRQHRGRAEHPRPHHPVVERVVLGRGSARSPHPATSTWRRTADRTPRRESPRDANTVERRQRPVQAGLTHDVVASDSGPSRRRRLDHDPPHRSVGSDEIRPDGQPGVAPDQRRSPLDGHPDAVARAEPAARSTRRSRSVASVVAAGAQAVCIGQLVF